MTNPDRHPSGRRPRRRASRFGVALACVAFVALASSATFAASHAGHAAASGGGVVSRFAGFFDNYGHYMPRIHCLQKADGTPDWGWIGLLIALNGGVVIGYARIFRFWRRSYLMEEMRDRNRKLMDLAHIFLWCAICGYALAIMMFWWPAYRLNAIALAVLNFFTWRFAHNLHGLRVSLSAFRLQRELRETLESRAAELERLVVERTAELEQARAKAITADKAKTDFLANMSHEIRTPMTAILGFTQVMSRRGLDDATRLKYTKIVRQNGEHLLTVINDVLDLARIEAGQLVVEQVPCDLPALLREVQTLWSAKAAEKSLTLELRVADAVPQQVATDPTRLKQVLFNLVGNAIKFTERGGVTIEAAPTADGRTRIDVVDTGIGMSPTLVAELFNRFSQGEATTARRFGGSGLGLVISRHLVGMLGGEIAIASVPGEGSRLAVSLPFAPTPAPAAIAEAATLAELAAEIAPSAPMDVTLSGVRVLVADDAADNRGLVAHLLAQAGASVEFALDGREAVDRVQASPKAFDVILMDMHMPRLDGYAATTVLRQAGVRIPIVAVTANSMAGERERCLTAGCDEYVTKPIDVDELLAVVERFGRRRASETGEPTGGPKETAAEQAAMT